jgi:hypothetical protein
VGSDPFPAVGPNPPPAGPYGATLAAFNGTDPNGTWRLYGVDQAAGGSGTIAGGWSITITTNLPPIAGNDTASASQNTAVPIAVLANDTDPDGILDPATVTVASGPTNGSTSVNASTGVVTYTPNAGFSGPDSFTYTVRDNNGVASNAATVSITVIAPTATFTPTATETSTPTPILTPTGTATPTATGPPSPTATATSTAPLVPTSTTTSTPSPTAPAVLTATATPTDIPPAPPRDENKEDSPRTVTEEQRQQRQRTNAGNRDDVATEGNVVEVTRTSDGLVIVIANADGLVTVVYPCGSSCPTIRVGDYVQVSGEKVNEQLYQADDVTVTH